MTDENIQLDQFFQEYRAACPEIEPQPGFMPLLWQRIEARQSFWSTFGSFGKPLTTASAALCLLVLLISLVVSGGGHTAVPTYTDALMADHSAENTYYAEAIRNSTVDGEAGSAQSIDAH